MFFMVNLIKQKYLFNNKASCHSIYFKVAISNKYFKTVCKEIQAPVRVKDIEPSLRLKHQTVRGELW